MTISDVCEWKLDDLEVDGYWVSGCYNNEQQQGYFGFNNGDPKDNGFKYCPFCGKSLIIEESVANE